MTKQELVQCILTAQEEAARAKRTLAYLEGLLGQINEQVMDNLRVHAQEEAAQ